MPESNIYSRYNLRISAFRVDARFLLTVYRAFQLPDDVKQELSILFRNYLELSARTFIVLSDSDSFYCFMPYKHRFKNVRELIERFNALWANASKRFRYAVFWTVTFNPRTLNNMSWLEHRYYAMRALNRLLSYLRKRFGKVSYIAVVEIMDNGLIHFHLVIFNLKRIEDYHVLNKRLEGWGFGRVHFIYSMINKNGVWVPVGVDRIDNCDGGGLDSRFSALYRNGLQSYLKKYLLKTLRSLGSLDSSSGVFQTQTSNGQSMNIRSSSKNGLWKLALYWASNLRFFTHSRDLAAASFRVGGGGRYEFVGVVFVDDYVFHDGVFYSWDVLGFQCFDVVSLTELML